jgi:S-adenosylmethionine uptake transporter
MAEMSDNTRGALMMMASMAAFTVNDACFKLLGETVPLFQGLFLRGLITTGFLFVLAWQFGQLRFDLPRREWGLIAIRTVSEIAAAWLFLTALFNMPIANVSAILQALPLTVTLAGALFLGEAVGWRRMVAILIGFAGVLLIVKPGTEGFTIYSLSAVASVACVTVRDLVVRRMARSTPSVMVAAVAAGGVALFGGAGSAFIDWAPMGPREMLLLAGAASFVVGGYLFSVIAMRTGEIGFVTPFRYTSLVVALVLGALVFGTFPDGWTLLGAAIVVATGTFTLLRERHLRRRALRAARAAG